MKNFIFFHFAYIGHVKEHVISFPLSYYPLMDFDEEATLSVSILKEFCITLN